MTWESADTLKDKVSYQHLLNAIVVHRVAKPTGSLRATTMKTPAKKYFTFIKPRHEAKRNMANGVRDK